MRTLFSVLVVSSLLASARHGSAGGSASAPVDTTESLKTDAPKTAAPVVDVPKFDEATGETVLPEGLTGEVHLPKKLVAKEIVGRGRLIYRKKFIKDAEGKETEAFEPLLPEPLYVVFGQARDTKTGESDYGPWVAFLGHFEAIDLQTGERYVSTVLHLQDPAEGLLIDQLSRRKEASDTVGFMFEVGKKPSQKWMDTDNGNSYEFTVKTHFQIDKVDPLAEMRRLALKSGTLAATMKRLAAPK